MQVLSDGAPQWLVFAFGLVFGTLVAASVSFALTRSQLASNSRARDKSASAAKYET